MMRPISVGMVPFRLLEAIGNVGEGEDNRYKARLYVRVNTDQLHTSQENNLPMRREVRLVMRPISVGMVPFRLLPSIGNVGE